ncbi:hypothetical protein J25TS5_32870 [Paenibacillus faecis]|uniref:hypothetical protein n=1 Tax=Paenibacillus faecis TaxID=862114 RepID=UPI001B05E085|nr:hypothetical protein [Paenibacillus faecis]GIO86355.1 hypothetical protein J25TS5_32870 [Paenibacillus faecis]
MALLLQVCYYFYLLQILMAAIMAVFPRNEVMRSKTGIASYTPNPRTFGDYFFNGWVLLIAGGALYMERVNEWIVWKPWWFRIIIRCGVLLLGIMAAFVMALIYALFQE